MNLKLTAKRVIQKQAAKGIKHEVCPRRESRTNTVTYIASPRVRSSLDFLAYLHELGHCKAEQPDFYFAVQGNSTALCTQRQAYVTKWNDSRLQCEFNAWVWALRYYRRLGGKLGKAQKDMVIKYFGNYLYDAKNKQKAQTLAFKMKQMLDIDQTHDKFYEGY